MIISPPKKMVRLILASSLLLTQWPGVSLAFDVVRPLLPPPPSSGGDADGDGGGSSRLALGSLRRGAADSSRGSGSSSSSHARRRILIATITDIIPDQNNNQQDDANYISNHVIQTLLQRGDEVILLQGESSIMDPPVNDQTKASEETMETTTPLTKSTVTFPFSHSSSTSTSSSLSSSVIVYHGDFSKNVTLEQIIQEQGAPTHVLYFMAQPQRPVIVEENEPDDNNDDDYDDDWQIHQIHTSLHVLVRLLQMAVHYPVENFVLASTSAIYDTAVVRSSLATRSISNSNSSPEKTASGAADAEDGTVAATLETTTTTSRGFVSRDEQELVDYPLSTAAATQKSAELYAFTWRFLYQVQTTALRLFSVAATATTANAAATMSNNNQDLARGVVRALDRPMPEYEIFNLGDAPQQCPPSSTLSSLSSPLAFVSKYTIQNALERIESSTNTIRGAQPDDSSDASEGVDKWMNTRSAKEQQPVIWMCPNVSKAVSMLGYETTEDPSDADVTNGETSSASQVPATTITHDKNNQWPTIVPWQDLSILEPHTGKKKVLVTGGAGFIGSHVADFLLARGDSVVIIDEVNDYYDVNIKEGNLNMLQSKYGGTDRLQIYRGDICNETLVRDIYETQQPKWICHLAARAGVRPSIEDPYVYIHSNIQGTMRLLELSREYGVENFVFASSSSIYGGSKSHYFSEDERGDNPISPYAASKKSCELLAFRWHVRYQLNVTALRFFTVYGPRGRPDMAPFKFVDRISQGLQMQQFGDGSTSRDYTYIDDIVNGVVRAVDRPYPFQIFNLGKGTGTKLSDFIQLVEKYTGNVARIQVMPEQPGDVPYTCADMNKAQRLLGYTSTVPFEEGIKRTVEWYQEAYPQNITKIGGNSHDQYGNHDNRDNGGSSLLLPSTPLSPPDADADEEDEYEPPTLLASSREDIEDEDGQTTFSSFDGVKDEVEVEEDEDVFVSSIDIDVEEEIATIPTTIRPPADTQEGENRFDSSKVSDLLASQQNVCASCRSTSWLSFLNCVQVYSFS
jgi:UDP-glucuronate 4-epimerase